MRKFLKIALIVLLFTVSTGTIAFTLDNDLKGFKAIHISSIWEMPLNSGGYATFPNNPDLIYSKEYQILREPYSITTIYSKINHSGEEITDEKRESQKDTCCHFFISKRGVKFGMLYRSLKDSSGTTYNVDSMITELFRYPSIFYKGRGRGKDSLTLIKDINKGLLVEKILQRKYGDDKSPDSSFFYYRKKPLDYSYFIKDKRLDHMYLYKAIIFNHIPKTDDKNNLDKEKTKFKFSFEINDIDIPDPEGIKIIIEKFKRSSVIN